MPPKIIETSRLILRLPQRSDAEEVFRAYAQDKHVVTYLAWRPHQSLEETIAFLNERIAEWVIGPRYSWTIVRNHDDMLLGMLSIRWLETFRISMSYVIRRDTWGQGYGTEAAQAIIEWALHVPEIFRVEACCDLDNLGSVHVLEKLGMTREGILRRAGYAPNVSTEPRDCYSYAITK